MMEDNNIKPPNSAETADFYDRLMRGEEKRGFLGKDRRYNPRRVIDRVSTQKYFIEVVRAWIKPTDKVLDLGCGPGSFLAAIAPLCGEIVGADISQQFVNSSRELIEGLEIPNARTLHIRANEALPFREESFDVLIMVDVIHHLEDIPRTLSEAMRVLKKNGRVLIFEPNKLNPLIWLVHLVDKNEWGLLKVGTPRIYRRILRPFMTLERIDFNGIVIGPESKALDHIADFLNRPKIYPVLGWLNPKMFVTGRKRDYQGCPFCSERKEISLMAETMDRYSGEKFTVCYCPSCRIAWTAVPEDFDVLSYYPSLYYGEKGQRFSLPLESFIRFFRKGRARLIQGRTGTKGSILDIGCGRGVMLNELKRKGWEVTGVEWSEDAVKAGELPEGAVHISRDLRSLRLKTGEYDAVSLWHVMEHLKDPRETLKEIRRVLRPGGRLFVEVPNFDSWQRAVDRDNWIYWEVPRHLYHFSFPGLNKMMKEEGLEEIDCTSWSLEFGPFGMMQAILNRLLPAKNFLFFLIRTREKKSSVLKGNFFLNLLLLIILIVPAALLGLLLESASAMNGKGGVVRCVYQKPLP